MRTTSTQSSSADLLIRSDHPRTYRKLKPQSSRHQIETQGESSTRPIGNQSSSSSSEKEIVNHGHATLNNGGDPSPYLAVGAAAARHISCLFSPTPMAPPSSGRPVVESSIDRSTTSLPFPSLSAPRPAPLCLLCSLSGLRWKTEEILVDQRSAAGGCNATMQVGARLGCASNQ